MSPLCTYLVPSRSPKVPQLQYQEGFDREVSSSQLNPISISSERKYSTWFGLVDLTWVLISWFLTLAKLFCGRDVLFFCLPGLLLKTKACSQKVLSLCNTVGFVIFQGLNRFHSCCFPTSLSVFM